MRRCSPAMLVMNVVWFRRSDRGPAQQFLVTFQIMAIIPVAIAFVGRLIDVWQFLVLQPLRLAPLVIPLVFFLQLVRRVRELAARRVRPAVVAPAPRRSSPRSGIVLALTVTSPLLAAPRMVDAHRAGLGPPRRRRRRLPLDRRAHADVDALRRPRRPSGRVRARAATGRGHLAGDPIRRRRRMEATGRRARRRRRLLRRRRTPRPISARSATRTTTSARSRWSRSPAATTPGAS